MPAISYKPDECKLTYGVYICRKCDSGFYGGGKALHKSNCVSRGYKDTYYCFGEKESWRLCFDISIPSQEIINTAKSSQNEIIEY